MVDNLHPSLRMTCFPESSASAHMRHLEKLRYGLRETPTVPDSELRITAQVPTASRLIPGDRREAGQESSSRSFFEQLMQQKLQL